jgi:predicted nucleic acid-binding protein
MALIARYLVDTSAGARATHPAVGERLAALVGAGLVATCGVLDSEALLSARDRLDYERIWLRRRLAYEYLPIEDESWRDALDAQRALAQTGRHTAVGMADLLTAVLAARHGLAVLHYDADFEIAAEVVDFDQHWVVPRGTA